MSKKVKLVGKEPQSVTPDSSFIESQAAILAAAGIKDDEVQKTLEESNINKAIRSLLSEEPFRRFYCGSSVKDSDCFNINLRSDAENTGQKARALLMSGTIALLSYLVREAHKADSIQPLIQQIYDYDEQASRDVSAILLLHRNAQIPGDFMDRVPVFGVGKPHPDLRAILELHKPRSQVDGFAFKGLVSGGLHTYVPRMGKYMDFAVDRSVFCNAEVHLFSSVVTKQEQRLSLDDII